jgi:hypothetical protein
MKKEDEIQYLSSPPAPTEGVSGGALRIFRVKEDSESKKRLALRGHDVTAALRTLRFALEALQSGYRFEDDKAQAKLETLSKALGVLEAEAPLLQKLFFGR